MNFPIDGIEKDTFQPGADAYKIAKERSDTVPSCDVAIYCLLCRSVDFTGMSTKSFMWEVTEFVSVITSNLPMKFCIYETF